MGGTGSGAGLAAAMFAWGFTSLGAVAICVFSVDKLCSNLEHTTRGRRRLLESVVFDDFRMMWEPPDLGCSSRAFRVYGGFMKRSSRLTGPLYILHPLPPPSHPQTKQREHARFARRQKQTATQNRKAKNTLASLAGNEVCGASAYFSRPYSEPGYSKTLRGEWVQDPTLSAVTRPYAGVGNANTLVF